MLSDYERKQSDERAAGVAVFPGVIRLHQGKTLKGLKGSID
jgi:hypothetical protein